MNVLLDNSENLCYNGYAMMKLQSKLRYFCCALAALAIGCLLALACLPRSNFVFAGENEYVNSEYFLTVYDDGKALTVKTTAGTVREALERIGISVNDSDIVDPGLDTEITTDSEYYINVHRARPAIVIDGLKRRYVMTASFNPKQIALEAGYAVYDGDEITAIPNSNFLESGVASTYKITRNGGRTVTVEETIPYATETRYDYSLAKGERRLEQAGEDGRKVSIYEVQFKDNVEASRSLVSEEIKLEAIPEIVVIGAKQSIPPERERCANWAREAGVSEADLEAAVELIYRESGCRVDATNAGSGAYGIPQALPKTKLASAGPDWETNPVTQIRWMIGYVNERYGGWTQALNFWWCTGQCANRYGTVEKRGTWY